jgi:prepilin-type processing-associated H-X9-DG protein
MATTINSESGQGISSVHIGGAHVLFVDGSAWFLSDKQSAVTLRSLLTRNGGEKIGEF